MCFSIQIDRSIKQLAKAFNAEVSSKSYAKFLHQQKMEAALSPETLKNTFGLKRKPKSPIFRTPDEDKRVFPNYFTHVMTLENKKRLFEPMRYRIRPSNSGSEIPSKYNVFNARLDSLERRDTWSPLFMKNHGVIAFNYFYEWVTYKGKKRLIIFKPKNHDIMWAPTLWTEWTSKDKKFNFKSFAIITDDPPESIESQGHDRCPIFLKKDLIDEWLSPKSKEAKEIYNILKERESDNYIHKWTN